jgi:hypothetical protein
MELTVWGKILSLMDGFSRFNKVQISLKDQHKTNFTCPWGAFFWNIIPFGLKIYRATYQKAMITIFHDMIHNFMEDCVDDLLEKLLET